jgi:hypothetical protein
MWHLITCHLHFSLICRNKHWSYCLFTSFLLSFIYLQTVVLSHYLDLPKGYVFDINVLDTVRRITLSSLHNMSKSPASICSCRFYSFRFCLFPWFWILYLIHVPPFSRKVEKACKILVWQPQRKRPHWRQVYVRRGQNVSLRNGVWRIKLDWTGSGWGPAGLLWTR